MNPTLDQVIEFLNDEGLAGSIKITKNDPDDWALRINDPWVIDSKLRCGIALKYPKYAPDGIVLFNTFKSSVLMGDDFKGSFWKFVNLIKEFNSINESKLWFMKNYMLHDIDISSLFHKQTKAPKKQTKEDVIFLDEFEILDFNNTSHKKYIDYLFDRKISKFKIENTKLFIDKKEERIIFPVYENNKLLFWTGRSINKNSTMPWKHKKSNTWPHPIWNLENVESGSTVVIFEAIFDAIMVHNGIAILGASNIQQEQIDKIIEKNLSKIVIIMDNDAAGIKTKLKLAELLSKHHPNIWIYDFSGIKEKDFNQMAQNNIDFDFSNRLIKYNFQSQLAEKLHIIK